MRRRSARSAGKGAHPTHKDATAKAANAAQSKYQRAYRAKGKAELLRKAGVGVCKRPKRVFPAVVNGKQAQQSIPDWELTAACAVHRRDVVVIEGVLDQDQVKNK